MFGYRVVVEELVEHWWNRSWGSLTRRDVKLFHGPDGWRAEKVVGGHEWELAGTEQQCRAAVAAELVPPWDWRRMA